PDPTSRCRWQLEPGQRRTWQRGRPHHDHVPVAVDARGLLSPPASLPARQYDEGVFAGEGTSELIEEPGEGVVLLEPGSPPRREGLHCSANPAPRTWTRSAGLCISCDGRAVRGAARAARGWPPGRSAARARATGPSWPESPAPRCAAPGRP